MKPYDPARPLIFIHVPKTAGSSVLQIMQSWYGDDLILHYFDEGAGRMPERLDLAARQRPGHPLAVFGHFNRLRGFGIDDYYPGVDQFVTILRDPAEIVVSGYHYLRANPHLYADKSRIPEGDVADFLQREGVNMLNHFPGRITAQNFREVIDRRFVAIGTMERLRPSMELIARRLGFPFDPESLPFLNATPRADPAPPGFRDQVRAAFPLEYQVYDYACERLESDLAAG